MTTTPVFSLEGGCDCGRVRYRMPPGIHISTVTGQPWMVLPPSVTRALSHHASGMAR